MPHTRRNISLETGKKEEGSNLFDGSNQTTFSVPQAPMLHVKEEDSFDFSFFLKN
jgi:hypothetical protein